ncbi:MAG TPA: hypothetical protein VHW23_33535 [Kofleriaceae bacterium]|jgi:hypothetical protein|nr:hypothetical protein [Kofleriaceae bacterium]
MKRYVSMLMALGLILAVAVSRSAADPVKDPSKIDRLDRMLGLARIWAEVKFFHPAMFQRAIDWDGALIKAMPAVEAASDAASYRAAIAHLLAAVGDPQTRVDDSHDEAPAADWKSWATKDVLVLDARLPTGRWDIGATRQIAHGIQPAITIRPTLRGVRAGKDEVLDRAVRYLQTGR